VDVEAATAKIVADGKAAVEAAIVVSKDKKDKIVAEDEVAGKVTMKNIKNELDTEANATTAAKAALNATRKAASATHSHFDGDTWTANMPEHHLKGYVQLKHHTNHKKHHSKKV